MYTDAQVRTRAVHTGLDTLVVHAVYDVDLEVVPLISVASEANAISRPPGEYDRQVKTKMYCRGPAPTGAHVV